MRSSARISLSRRLRLSRPVRKPPSGPWCTGAAAGVGSMLPLRGTNAVWAKSMRRTSTKHWLSSVGGADMSSDLELCCRAALRRCSLLLSRSRPASREFGLEMLVEMLSQLRSCGAVLAGEDTADTDFLASLESHSPRAADCWSSSLQRSLFTAPFTDLREEALEEAGDTSERTVVPPFEMLELPAVRGGEEADSAAAAASKDCCDL